MKKYYYTMFIIFLILAVGTVLFMILLPDQVPVHYNFKGEVDRMGSKYENLIFPLIAMLIGVIFMLMAGSFGRKGQSSSEKGLVIAGTASLIFFTLLGFYLMYRAMKYDPAAAPEVSFDDVNRFVSIGIGTLLVVLGNIMPKVEGNQFFGIRTRWSMANDVVWRRCQRFGGIVTVIGGFMMIILSLFIGGMGNVLMMTIMIAVILVLCIYGSRRIYRDYTESKKQ